MDDDGWMMVGAHLRVADNDVVGETETGRELDQTRASQATATW